jgi:fused signal recognition particle receptor
MFGLLKKKLSQLFKRTSTALEKEAKVEEKTEERELETEIKEIETKEEELKQEEEKIEEDLEESEKELPRGHEEISYEKENKELLEEKEEIKEKEIEEIEEKVEQLEEKKESLFSKLKKVFTTTRLNEEGFDQFFNELESVLIENNVAIEAIDFMRSELKKEIVEKDLRKGKVQDEIKDALEKAIDKMLIEPPDVIDKIKSSLQEKKPYVLVFFGINGVGKTLSIAKVAHLLKQNKLSCVLAASDTFRAAAIEQLSIHAERLKVPMIKHQYGADPAAVAFDAIAHAKSNGIDVVLIDTAGRMHTKTDLMREMEKIVRVAKPDMKIFVGEAIAGNDAIEQAKTFDEVAGIDGIILTKSEVDERGGTSISVSYVTGKPVLFLGTGQEYSELKRFDKKALLKAIFE